MSDQNIDNDAKYAGEKVKNKLDEAAGAAQQQFGKFFDSPEDEAKGAGRKYAARASDVLTDVTDTVKNNPLSGLIAAGAVGVVLGLLLGRK